MEHNSEVFLWSQIQPILLNHFCNSAVEFSWYENTPLAKSFLSHCILFQCILLNINVIEKNVSKFSRQDTVSSQVLKINVPILIKQRLSTGRSLFLVYDSIFPSKSEKYFSLQLTSNYHGMNDPMKFLTAVLLQTSEISQQFHHPANWFVDLEFTSVALLFVSPNENFLLIGSIANDGKDDYDLDKFQIVLRPFPNGLSSFKHLLMVWRQFHRNINIRNKFPINQDHCVLTTLRKQIVYASSSCATLEAYFSWTNCSNFHDCHRFYTQRIGLAMQEPKVKNLITYAFPNGLKKINFFVQIVFPKLNLFDTNLTAFLTPLDFMT